MLIILRSFSLIIDTFSYAPDETTTKLQHSWAMILLIFAVRINVDQVVYCMKPVCCFFLFCFVLFCFFFLPHLTYKVVSLCIPDALWQHQMCLKPLQSRAAVTQISENFTSLYCLWEKHPGCELRKAGVTCHSLMNNHPLTKQHPPPTFVPISCIVSSLLKLAPTLERALSGVWETQPQVLWETLYFIEGYYQCSR